MPMQNLSGGVREMYFLEKIVYHLITYIFCLFHLIPKADHYFLFYGNAPAFISPESSYRLQHMEVSYSILHFECIHTHRSNMKCFGNSLALWTMAKCIQKRKIKCGMSMQNLSVGVVGKMYISEKNRLSINGFG